VADPNASTDFVRRVNAATESAFEEIDQRYRRQLCALVERELSKRFARREDPEDAVQSALRSFYRGVHAQRFHIDHSGALWQLLVKLVRRKVMKHVERHGAIKRTPKHETAVDGDQFASREPTPDEAAHVSDAIGQVLAKLDATGQEIFRLRLQGFTRGEIARETDSSEAVVRYRLDRIRDLLTRVLHDT